LILFFILISPFLLIAQNKKEKIYTAYINNFANYTSWPKENKTDSFRILVITENNDIVAEFNEFAKKRKIKEKPVDLKITKTYTESYFPHIIFVTSEKQNLIPHIYENIDGRPVLLVTESCMEQRNIMINFYNTEQGKILFEVNKANILNQGLNIDPEILLAGGSEIDMATLYRKSQLSLRELQKEKDLIADSIQILRQNIEMILDMIRNKQNEIIVQNEHISNSNQRIFEDDEKIKIGEKRLKALNDSIKRKNAILDKQYRDMEKQWTELAKQEKLLKEKQQNIELLNKEIEQKNKNIDNQLEVISRQKNTMFLLIIISLLIITLAISIFVSFYKNKQKRKILAQQKMQIESKLQEVKELNEKLKIADQYKSIFLASMSHELRTPLNSIIGYTGIILMGMTGKLNEEQSKQLNKVKNNARHLLNLINDILDISKIEADRVDLIIEQCNLKPLVDEVIEMLYPKAIEKKLNIYSRIPDNIIIETDNRRLKQVILNLATNAVNYTNEGEINIEAEVINNTRVRVIVKDTGIGIPDDELPRLFQPFHQIDVSLTKKNTSGTGLGLYLCKKIMNLLNGEIYVKSKTNEGSCFYIELDI